MRSGNEYFCHREAITGSQMKTEVCLTRQQLDAKRAQAAAFVDEVQQMGTRAPANSTPGQGGAY
jgi:hypothetical protein